MQTPPLNELIGNTDIYLLDQILKRRYQATDRILDAGCGGGRNLFWFINNEIEIYGIDKDPASIRFLKSVYPKLEAARFQVSKAEQLPFENDFFDHLISSAVLHFAESTTHFFNMVKEQVRVLQSKGSLFIRMATTIGMEDKVKLIGDGLYHIPDGTSRFLLTPALLENVMKAHNLSFIEPLKTVNVDNLRSMSTLVLLKN